MPNYLGFPTVLSTSTLGASYFTRLQGILNAQLNGALQSLAPSGCVLVMPDGDSFKVADAGGVGIGVTIAPGAAIARSDDYGAVFLSTAVEITLPLDADATSFIFAAILVDEDNDSRVDGSPQIVISETDTLEGGVLLAEVTTDGVSVTEVIDRRHLVALVDVLQWRGAWDAGEHYSVPHIVSHDDSLWLAVDESDNIEPGTDGDVWIGFGGDGSDADTLEGEDGSFYLSRANHTGTQAQSTITNLVTDLAAKASVASVDLKADQTALDTEETAREAADTALQGDIDDHIAETAPHTDHMDVDGSKPFTGDVDFGGNIAGNAADGVAATDLATVGQLATAAAGFAPRPAVRVATAAALPANTRTSNTLTANANGSINGTGIDGVVDLAIGDRVLVKDESVGANNGVYEVDAVGSAGVPWAMTRVSDFDASGEATLGAYYPVQEGAVNAESSWYLATDSVTLNTTALVFSRDARGGGRSQYGCQPRLRGCWRVWKQVRGATRLLQPRQRRHLYYHCP